MPRSTDLARLIVLLTMLSTAAPALSTDTGSFDTLTAKATEGDPGAQLALAIRYRDGTGVAGDPAAAMMWGHRAADQGHAEALDFVGFSYLRGAMVRQNPVIALGYFKAAAGGSAQGAFNLGQCYYGAQGTEQDCAKALECWEKAAENGHGRAAATAAMAYLSGEGVEPNPTKARHLAERAAELNNASGLVVLGEMQFQAGDIESAKANWTKASQLHPTGETGHQRQGQRVSGSQLNFRKHPTV